MKISVTSFSASLKVLHVSFFLKGSVKLKYLLLIPPHYSLAKAWVSNEQEDIALAKKYYADYIKSSLGISEPSQNQSISLPQINLVNIFYE